MTSTIPDSSPADKPRRRAYPKRPPYFACQFIRLLAKKCVANELGPQTFTLLAVIVTTEDARGYTDAVTFFNTQLMPVVGLKSVDTLDRVRRRAVDAGWLHYAPGGKGVPGRYFVTVPEQYRGTDDGPTDEGGAGTYLRTGAEVSAEESRIVRTGAEGTGEQVRKEPESKCGTFFPSPDPVPNTGGTPAGAGVGDGEKGGRKKQQKAKKQQKDEPWNDCPAFLQFYAAYPNKKDKPAAWRAWQDKVGSDERRVAEVMAGLARYKAQKEGWRAWKHPGPWLNARMWEDYPDPAPAEIPPVIKRPTDNPLLAPERLTQNCPPMG